MIISGIKTHPLSNSGGAFKENFAILHRAALGRHSTEDSNYCTVRERHELVILELIQGTFIFPLIYLILLHITSYIIPFIFEIKTKEKNQETKKFSLFYRH